MNIRKYSKIGTYHAAAEGENQDYLYSMENKDYLAVMLADGATACGQGQKGARLACEAAGRIIEQEGDVFFHYPKEKIAYLLSEQILYWLECNKDREEDIHEYGSTFMLAFMEKKNGRTVFVNLGDGAAISVKEKGISYLMRPRRIHGNPCLTTTEGASRMTKVEVMNVSLGENIILCSDGFLDQMSCGSSIELLKNFDLETLDDELQMSDNRDDCSYIAYTRERK